MMTWCRISSMASVLCIIVLVMSVVLLPDNMAAAAASAGGYFAGYENTDPKPTSMSWWSTLAYIISLLIVFAFVVVMAYFASRFLSGRFCNTVSASGGRILDHLPLGPNRSVCVVELAGRFLMLGVCEGGISLLGEITDPREIEQLQRKAVLNPIGDTAFSDQLNSIQQLVKRVPSFIKDARQEYSRKK